MTNVKIRISSNLVNTFFLGIRNAFFFLLHFVHVIVNVCHSVPARKSEKSHLARAKNKAYSS